MKRKWRWVLFALVPVPIFVVAYVRSHPLVFMGAHQHCIKAAGMQLHGYADQNDGRFPFDPRGYGHALLLMNEECFQCLTGPGYDASPLYEAKRTGGDLPEEMCGRVYVQGLTTKSDSEIAILFDKLPTPGGDHCHLPIRLWAPLGREVWFVGGQLSFVVETEWPEFSSNQVELLVKEGFNRQEVERLYEWKAR